MPARSSNSNVMSEHVVHSLLDCIRISTPHNLSELRDNFTGKVEDFCCCCFGARQVFQNNKSNAQLTTDHGECTNAGKRSNLWKIQGHHKCRGRSRQKPIQKRNNFRGCLYPFNLLNVSDVERFTFWLSTFCGIPFHDLGSQLRALLRSSVSSNIWSRSYKHFGIGLHLYRYTSQFFICLEESSCGRLESGRNHTRPFLKKSNQDQGIKNIQNKPPYNLSGNNVTENKPQSVRNCNNKQY